MLELLLFLNDKSHLIMILSTVDHECAFKNVSLLYSAFILKTIIRLSLSYCRSHLLCNKFRKEEIFLFSTYKQR